MSEVLTVRGEDAEQDCDASQVVWLDDSTTDDGEAKSRLTLPPKLTGAEEDAEQDRGTS